MASGPLPPPPGAWSMMTDARPKSNGAELPRINISDASSAWKHCKNVSRDDGRAPDLYDLLSHSVRETQYSFPPQGWPSQVRMISPIISEMPAMVTDRYNACQTVAFCGAFPEIRRAWATVDNSLFLWRFDTWQDIPIEYSGEEQAIISVGLVTPKAGVFVAAIKHLLIICTTTEIVLLGVCCSGTTYENITIQPLPLYTIPSDNIAMTSIATTTTGRIFLGGADGNLYELKYAAADSWKSKRCYKVCHTGGLRHYLPSFLPNILFGPTQALVDIVVDQERHVLYTRTTNSTIAVYDLGNKGDDIPRHVAEATDFLAEASRAIGGREVFGRGAGDKKGAAVVLMTPIPLNESRRVHLLTVTADGRRLYWSTMSSRTPSTTAPSSGGASARQSPRPDRLRADIARQAMPSVQSTARVGALHHHTAPSRGLEVVAACYASGALLLAESVPGEPRTKLFLLSRDLTVPPVSTATGARVAVQGLRESIAELGTIVPGEACAIRAVPWVHGSDISLSQHQGSSARDEVTTQNAAPAPRFVLVSTAGVVEVEKLRPADVLSRLLQEPGGAKLAHFFKSYGAAEAAAMCIQLAAAGPPIAAAAAVARARSALDDPHLCGEPVLKETEGGALGGGIGGGGVEELSAMMATANNQSFDMGAVVPVAEPEWSGAHKGLCLYVARLLQPIWDELIVEPLRSSPPLLRCAVSVDSLLTLEETLRSLDAFLKDFIARRKARRHGVGHDDPSSLVLSGPLAKRQRLEDAVKLELARTELIRSLVSRSADGCFLLRALVEHNISRLTARMEESARSMLRTLRFRDWVASEDGEAAATQLIAVLVSEHLSAVGGLAEDLAAALQRGCPSYFRESDRTYYDASGLLRKAESATNTADRAAYTKDAVALLLKVPLACDLGQIVPQLALLRSFDAMVDLPVRKAAALDPADLAAGSTAAAEAARARRLEYCYAHVADVLRALFVAPSSSESSSASASNYASLEAFYKSVAAAEREALRRDVLQKISGNMDVLFHECVYATLVDLNAIKEILSMDTPFLEDYLAKASGLIDGSMNGGPAGPLSTQQAAHADVLARYYISKREYAAAAGVYELLASQTCSVTEPAEPSLKGRVSYLQAAVLQARSCGVAGLVDRLETKLRLAELQSRLIQVLQELVAEYPESQHAQQQGEGADIPWSNLGMEISRQECKTHITEMQRCLYSLEGLYNDVARPCHLWADCLEMVDISSLNDRVYVSQLWDLYLKQSWNDGWSRAPGGDIERCVTGVQRAAEKAMELGSAFYPNEGSFPVASVLLRLEQMCAGIWPVQSAELELDSSVAYGAILEACGGAAYDVVIRAYESLLSVRSGDVHGEELHGPRFRHRLLRSMRNVIESGRDKALAAGGVGLGMAGRRELGVLAAACEAYAAEARKLPVGYNGEQLAEEFGSLGDSVQGLMGYAGTALYA